MDKLHYSELLKFQNQINNHLQRVLNEPRPDSMGGSSETIDPLIQKWYLDFNSLRELLSYVQLDIYKKSYLLQSMLRGVGNILGGSFRNQNSLKAQRYRKEVKERSYEDVAIKYTHLVAAGINRFEEIIQKDVANLFLTAKGELDEQVQMEQNEMLSYAKQLKKLYEEKSEYQEQLQLYRVKIGQLELDLTAK